MVYDTSKKRAVIDFLSKSSFRAYTVEEICSFILKDGRGKSSIYRIISKLVDEGKIRRICDTKTRKVTYQDANSGECNKHLHLKCNSCGKLIHLSNNASLLLKSELSDATGFVIDSGAYLYGKCASCTGGSEVK